MAVHRRRRGLPPLRPPPPFQCLRLTANNFASAPSVPRGFKLQKFWPAPSAGTIGGPSGGGGSQPNPPSPPSVSDPPSLSLPSRMMRSPQGGLSAGMDRRKVVTCPRGGSEPASGHPRAQTAAARRGAPTPHRRYGGAHSDAPGQRRGAGALLRVDPTQSSEIPESPGVALVQPPGGKEREVEG